MRFDARTGSIELLPGTPLTRGISRRDLLALQLPWESWMTLHEAGQVISYRAIFSVRHQSNTSRLILVVDLRPDNGVVRQWRVLPYDLERLYQARPEGKLTKKVRRWFFEQTGVQLPQGGDWGDTDVLYDPHNLNAYVMCNYRENFNTEEEWMRYRKKYGF